MCLDWDKERVLKPSNSGLIVISLIPCDIEWLQNYYGYEVDNECIADKEQQKAYLDPYYNGAYTTLLYYNFELFEAEKYGE